MFGGGWSIFTDARVLTKSNSVIIRNSMINNSACSGQGRPIIKLIEILWSHTFLTNLVPIG